MTTYTRHLGILGVALFCSATSSCRTPSSSEQDREYLDSLAQILPAPPTNGPALCQGNYLKPEQGKAVLDAALVQFPNREAWDAYARHVRERIQQGAGLAPWPRRTPLNPIIRARRGYDGYTVE